MPRERPTTLGRPPFGITCSRSSVSYNAPGQQRSRLCRVLPELPGEVIEHAQLIAVQICDPELAQAPRLILRLGEDLRPRVPPALIKSVNFVFTVQIQPDGDCFASTVVPAERRIRQEHTAFSLRDSADTALVVTPVEP